MQRANTLTPLRKKWKTIYQDRDADVCAGAPVRTDDSTLCEIQTRYDAKVRMNRGCEMVLDDAKKMGW